MRWLGVSTKPPAAGRTASPLARSTSSSVTPWPRSRSGSTITWSWRSRCPQMATLATPGMAISRGRTVHRISVVSSTWLRTFDVTPIFMTRLVDDSGESITGGRATDGSCPASVVRRSCTSCRACMRSVPSWKIATTDDKPRTLFERSVLSPRTPFSAFSIGTDDETLDLGRRETRRLGLDLDQGRRELGEHVERRLSGRLDAEDDEQHGERGHDDAQAESERDDPAHGLLPRSEFGAEQLGDARGHDPGAGGRPAAEHDVARRPCE